VWTSKVARFLAYIVDGGMLQSQFTLTSMVQMLQRVRDPSDERTLQREIAYLLHIRRVGQRYQREPNNTLERQLRELMQNYSMFSFNPKVLVVLIETGYI
jgi:hypothetical protein